MLRLAVFMLILQKDEKKENWAQEAVTAGKDTADLICFEMTHSSSLILFISRGQNITHIHSHSHSPCPRKDRDKQSPPVPWLGLFLARQQKQKKNSGRSSLTSEDLSDGSCMLARHQRWHRETITCFSSYSLFSSF